MRGFFLEEGWNPRAIFIFIVTSTRWYAEKARILFPINCLPLSVSRHLSSSSLLDFSAHLPPSKTHVTSGKIVFVSMALAFCNGHKWLLASTLLRLVTENPQPQGHPSPDQNWDIGLCWRDLLKVPGMRFEMDDWKVAMGLGKFKECNDIRMTCNHNCVGKPKTYVA